jgi:hypothetical protein
MKKLLIGISLTFGFIFLAVTVSVLLTKNPSEKDKNAALGGLMIGVPATTLGGWLIWDLRRQKKRSQQDRSSELEAIFLNQLQAHRGRITAISFAIATKLPLVEAKEYLDLKSNQLNSTFEIDESGSTSYYFHL